MQRHKLLWYRIIKGSPQYNVLHCYLNALTLTAAAGWRAGVLAYEPFNSLRYPQLSVHFPVGRLRLQLHLYPFQSGQCCCSSWRCHCGCLCVPLPDRIPWPRWVYSFLESSWRRFSHPRATRSRSSGCWKWRPAPEMCGSERMMKVQALSMSGQWEISKWGCLDHTV